MSKRTHKARAYGQPIPVSSNARFVRIDGSSQPIKNAAENAYNTFMGISTQGAYDFSRNDRGYEMAWAASVWAKRCIEILANCFMALPVRCLDNKTGEALDDTHAFTQLFDWRTRKLRWLTETQFQIYGRAFWKPYLNGRRVDYMTLNPTTIEVLRNRWGVHGFKQRVSGQLIAEFASDELVYFYGYDPEDDLSGIPAIAWILRTIGVDISTEQFTKTFFENDATPGGILTTEQRLQSSDQERIAQFWNKEHKGMDKKHRTAVLGHGVSYQVVTPSQKDLAHDILDEKTKRRIAAAFGVPTTIAIMDDAANYACLPAGELVYTLNGAVPIEYVESGTQVWAWHEGGLRPQKVTASIKQPFEPKVYEIKTRHRTLRASDNHLILTVKVTPGVNPTIPQQNSYAWKRADELGRGDFIVEAWQLPDQCGDTLPNGKQPTIELMELAGLYLADGSTSGRDLHFAVPDDEMGQYYQGTADKTFQYVKPELAGQAVKTRRRKNTFGFTVGSAGAYRLFDELGLTGTALTKQVPEWIYGLSNEYRLAFLRGFLDGDGTVGDRGACFAGANDRVIEALRVLAISCGLRVSNMQISDRDGNFGKCHLARFYARDAHLVGSNDPRYVAKMAKRLEVDRYDDQLYKGVVRQIDLPQGIQINKVQSVEYIGKMPVYDLTIENDHTFIANGVVVHNTAKEQHILLYTSAAIPNATMRFDTINTEVAPLYGDVRVEVAVDQIDVLQEDRVEITNRSTQGYQGGVRSLNESRELEGLPPLDNGDFYLINGKPTAKAEIESGAVSKPLADSTLTYSQIATYSGGVASLNEARQMQGLPPLPVDVFVVPNLGVVTRTDLEAGKLPMMPSVDSSSFGLPTLGGGTATQSVDADKGLGESVSVLLSIADQPDLIALQKQLQGMFPETEWNNPNDFCITLFNAPNATEVQRDQMVEIVKALPVPPITLRLGSLHAFDNLGSHALHFRTRRSAELEEYQEALYNAMAEAGIIGSAYSNPDTYIPHITMGYTASKPPSITYNSKLTVEPDKVLVTGGDYGVIYESPVAPLVVENQPKSAAKDLQLLELKRWKRKASTKGGGIAFETEYIGSATADFIRMDLAQGLPPKDVFDRAIKAVDLDDPDFATPEEFEAYWRGIGGLYDSLQNAMLTAWADLPRQVASNIRELGAGADLEKVMQDHEKNVLSTLIGTLDDPGALTKVVLAGAARGNDLLVHPRKATMTIAWDLLNQEALAWARDFANEQVTLVGNTTRQALQENIAAWIESGEPLTQLADAIEGTLDTSDMTIPAGFSPEKIKWLTSPERAALIAQTEATTAFHNGAQVRWTQAGVTEMRFRTQADSLVCPTCRSLNNTIGGIGQGFSKNGQLYQIPVHPNCRCFASPVVD